MRQPPVVKSSFTLIELLIVIVIIGILAGVVLSVLNPAKAQRKSAESVLKANVNKLCLAMFACFSTTATLSSCNNFNGIGITNPAGTPANSSYSISDSSSWTIPPASIYVLVIGTLPAGSGSEGKICSYRCNYFISTGVANNLYEYIPNTSYDCIM